MSLRRIFAVRVAMGIAAAWAILTAVFAMFTLTDDWIWQQELGLLRWAGEEEDVIDEVRNEYLAGRGLDRPWIEQYLDWLGNMVTLDWGTSFVTGDPAAGMVAASVLRTAMYVLPAILLAVVLGVVIGMVAALRPANRSSRFGVGVTYLAFAVPSFWIGGLAYSLRSGEVIGEAPLLFEHLLPIAFVTVTLMGGYVSYVRSHGREYATRDFVKLVTAKGAGRLRVAGHVLRNAAIPFVSLLFTEALALLILAIFVIEVLFGIDGFGRLVIDAVNERDLPVLLGATVVVIGLGVVGNIVQDVSYSLLDPRVDTGTR